MWQAVQMRDAQIGSAKFRKVATVSVSD